MVQPQGVEVYEIYKIHGQCRICEVASVTSASKANICQNPRTAKSARTFHAHLHVTPSFLISIALHLPKYVVGEFGAHSLLVTAMHDM
jgi:hypothetical protein